MTSRDKRPHTYRRTTRGGAAALLVLGIGGIGSWSMSHALGAASSASPVATGVPTNPPIVNATDNREADRPVSDPRPVDVTWLDAMPAARPSVNVGARLAGRPVVLVKTATWCPPCGGDAAVTRIEAAASADPGTEYVVVLHSEPVQRAEALAAAVTAPNLHLVLGDDTSGAGALPAEVGPAFGSTIPAVVRLSAGHAVTRVSVGAAAAQRALENR
jgi:hypothetical protein